MCASNLEYLVADLRERFPILDEWTIGSAEGNASLDEFVQTQLEQLRSKRLAKWQQDMNE